MGSERGGARAVAGRWRVFEWLEVRAVGSGGGCPPCAGIRGHARRAGAIEARQEGRAAAAGAQ